MLAAPKEIWTPALCTLAVASPLSYMVMDDTPGACPARRQQGALDDLLSGVGRRLACRPPSGLQGEVLSAGDDLALLPTAAAGVQQAVTEAERQAAAAQVAAVHWQQQ